MSRITRNAVKCLACGVVVESRHRHDYVVCGCPNHTMADGGLEYIRRGAVDFSLTENLTESVADASDTEEL